jgi:carotenoid cleavage dioxygenase-like enzyme
MRSRMSHVRYRLRDGRSDAEPEMIAGPAIELQQVHPGRVGQGRARVCWGSGNGERGEFFHCTHRIDLDSGAVATWQRTDATHLEPLFVPRPGGEADDDGVLLVPTLADSDETSVIGVIDARTMASLLIVRITKTSMSLLSRSPCCHASRCTNDVLLSGWTHPTKSHP